MLAFFLTPIKAPPISLPDIASKRKGIRMFEYVGAHYVELVIAAFVIFFAMLCFAITAEYLPHKD